MSNNNFNYLPKITLNNKNYVISNLERYINYTILRLSCSNKLDDFKKFNIKCNRDLEYFNINPCQGYTHFTKVFLELNILEEAKNDLKYESKYKIKRYKFNFDNFEELMINVFSYQDKIDYFNFRNIYNLFSNKNIPQHFKEFIKIYTSRQMEEYISFLDSNSSYKNCINRFSLFESFIEGEIIPEKNLSINMA